MIPELPGISVVPVASLPMVDWVFFGVESCVFLTPILCYVQDLLYLRPCVFGWPLKEKLTFYFLIVIRDYVSEPPSGACILAEMKLSSIRKLAFLIWA